MLKQRPIVYLALLAVLGSLLIMGVPIDRVLFIGLAGSMLVMHVGGHGVHGAHGGQGSGGRKEYGTDERHVTPAAAEDKVAGQ